MRRALGICVAVCVLAAAAYGQDSKKLLETFRRNFAIASLDVKIQILQDAASGPSAADMGALYQQAVDFVVDNASLVPSDPRFRQLAAAAAGQLARTSFAPARFSVWNLFQIDPDTTTLVNAAAALGVIGAGDPEIIGNLNRWLEAQNTIFSSGKPVDTQVVAACVQALGRLADGSSFPPLFGAVILGYPEPMPTRAREALLSLKGDLKESLLGIIRSRPFTDKRAALQMALESDRMSDEQKGQTAEAALDTALRSSSSDSPGKAVLREIRFAAARALGERKWSQATGLLVAHLDATIGEYDKGLADKRLLIEAVGALGATATHEAAVRLTQYLLLVNSYTEKSKGYDEQVVLAIIDALGQLGDRVAFEDLMYTQYLGYSAGVKKSARAALDRLKW
jgi:hypothetical protein